MKTLLLLSGLLFASTVSLATPLAQIEAGLKSPEGILAEIHGLAKEDGYMVLSFRDPNDFFSFTLVSMILNSRSSQHQNNKDLVASLHRHDFVRLKGSLLQSLETLQPHALIDQIELKEKFVSPYPELPPYQRKTQLVQELTGKTSAQFKVHAQMNNGEVLVLEYGDGVVPAYVTATAGASPASQLYRGDVIEAHFRMEGGTGRRPLHLEVDNSTEKLILKDSMLAQNGQRLNLCGTLVMFPKSPQIRFNVFALDYKWSDTITRTYTLVNFVDFDLFTKLREKLQTVWDAQISTMRSGRNYFINPQIQVCAQGVGNVKDPNQANPQILIDNLSDIQVRVTP